AARTGHPQKTQAPAQGSNGGHPPPPSRGCVIRQRFVGRRRAELIGTRIDPAGVPFVAGALVAAALGGAVGGWAVGLPFVLLTAIFLFFFRDPERHADPEAAGPDAVLAPADGRVLVAGPAAPDAAPPGTWQQVSIFLSPVDVHVNRIPVSGVV